MDEQSEYCTFLDYRDAPCPASRFAPTPGGTGIFIQRIRVADGEVVSEQEIPVLF